MFWYHFTWLIEATVDAEEHSNGWHEKVGKLSERTCVIYYHLY